MSPDPRSHGCCLLLAAPVSLPPLYPFAVSLPLQDRDFLLDVVVSAYQRRASQRAAINAMPLYPTEGLLWDTTQIPTGKATATPSPAFLAHADMTNLSRLCRTVASWAQAHTVQHS